jgi:hypothetical protein
VAPAGYRCRALQGGRTGANDGVASLGSRLRWVRGASTLARRGGRSRARSRTRSFFLHALLLLLLAATAVAVAAVVVVVTRRLRLRAMTHDSTSLTAVCISGLVSHGMIGSSAIHEPAQYNRLFTWLDGLRAGGAEVDVFMHIELYTHPAKTRTTETHAMRQTNLTSVPPHMLSRALDSLQPVKLSFHEEAPFCQQQPVYCQSTNAWPRWLDQMLKKYRCMQQIRKYELEKGRQYKWVIQMRSDYNTDGANRTSKAVHVLGVMRKWSADERLVHAKPYFPPPGYGQADWFWISQRAAADTLSSIVAAPYEWIRCVTNTSEGHYMQNERLWVEWMLRAGLRLAKMSSSPHLIGLTEGNQSPGRRCAAHAPAAVP